MNVLSSPLIDAETLAGRIADARLRVFDCRFDLALPELGETQYRSGHLPGARYVHLERDLSGPVTATTGRHPLPAPAQFAARLERWGVGDDSSVVAYDDGNGAYAARLWWMLRWLGHDDVSVLDGGFARWRALALPVTTAEVVHPAGRFTPRLRPDFTVDAAAVLVLAQSRDARVLDARAPERFRGDVEPIDRVAGHVPGAVNHPFAASLAADGTMLPRDELHRAFAASLGGVPPSRAVAMCGSGITAAHLLLAMEHAELGGARLYPGSWSEWIRDPSRPIARCRSKDP